MPTYRARETFLWRGRIVAVGDLLAADDPAYQRNAVLFDRIDAPPIERATAAPGERRAIRIPRKKES